jgi:hypothetical protein
MDIQGSTILEPFVEHMDQWHGGFHHKYIDVMRCELEKKDEYSLYSMIQSDLKPAVKDLLEDKERIDVLCELSVGDLEDTTKIFVGVKTW